MRSLDDALMMAEELLADYDASGLGDAPGPDILWRDQLARALRELATAASTWHVAPAGGRAAAVVRAAGQAGGRRRGRVRDGLARLAGARGTRAPESGTLALPAADADTVRQALADAGAWHGVYGDCAVCVAEGTCADKQRHGVIAVRYAALRDWLGGEAR